MADNKGVNIELIGKGLLYGIGAFALYKAGQKLGLFESKEDTQVEKDTQQANKNVLDTSANNALLAFNPNYYSTITTGYIQKYKTAFPFSKNYPPTAKIIEWEKRLWDSKAFWDDDEDKLWSIFRQITTQYQLSILSGSFSKYYKKDLLVYLKSFLGNKEMADLLDIVKNYPQYIK